MDLGRVSGTYRDYDGLSENLVDLQRLEETLGAWRYSSGIGETLMDSQRVWETWTVYGGLADPVDIWRD